MNAISWNSQSIEEEYACCIQCSYCNANEFNASLWCFTINIKPPYAFKLFPCTNLRYIKLFISLVIISKGHNKLQKKEQTQENHLLKSEKKPYFVFVSS